MFEDLAVTTARLLAGIDRLPAWYPRAIVRDAVDPDFETASVYYRHEGHVRTLGGLNNLRLMAQVAATATALAPLIAILADKETGMVSMSMGSLAEYRCRIERDLLAQIKERLTGSVTWHPAIELIDTMMEAQAQAQALQRPTQEPPL